MPRVAIRRTRASKTRGKSYQGKGKEEGIYCAATTRSFGIRRARIQRGYGSPDPRLDTVCPCLDQIKRVVFFVHPGFRSVLLGYEGNGSLKAASSNQQIALSSPGSRGGAGSRDDFIRPSRFQSPFETSERPILVRTLESKIRGIFPHARTIPIRINGRMVDPRRYSQSWTIEKFR